MGIGTRTYLDDGIGKPRLIFHIHRFRLVHPPRAHTLHTVRLELAYRTADVTHPISDIGPEGDKDPWPTTIAVSTAARGDGLRSSSSTGGGRVIG